ncbi:hypothetical protein ML401_19060 [Bradyrhizobium sp. 62B]|uniref:hypothetical protein n=1 Tax=Bradyrhizobium TaxID=374 RepID=UPI002168FC4F|nr:hypothetical protein [Bradyrhizobium centrosematis]MCS3759038.1 hypothetical protein [Bradyrhizobium centrosematis]MCS3773074.1 hypothetical protein [Bradyrhizobium centrosematis]WIW43624.1 hypothetical protein ML401_19060 [Bradyrhizobium sp. 62B]
MTSVRQIEANRSNAKRRDRAANGGWQDEVQPQRAASRALARSAISDPAEAEQLAVAIASGLGHQVTPDAAMALARSAHP